MSGVTLTSIMLFHADSAMEIMEEIIRNDLVNPDELHEILQYKESQSQSIQEERMWKLFQSFLIRSDRLPADVIPFSPELRGPDNNE